MRILGCDASSKLIGCVLLGADDGVPITIMLHGGLANDFEKRMEVLFFLMKDILMLHKPDIVYIEQAAYIQNIKATLMIDASINMIRATCIEAHIPYQIIDIKAWKKSVLGNGNASKTQIMDFAKAKIGVELDDNQDLADAFCVATYGMMRLK